MAGRLPFAWNGQEDNFDIYIKGIDSDIPLRLTTHPGEDRNPVWSEDGQYIAFIRRSQGEAAVFTIPVLGGPERRVHTLTRPLVLCPVGLRA
jgi:Tol biopolymer transport system component